MNKQADITSQFFVYGLSDPRTGELRYVGKSSHGMKRPASHLHPSKLRTATYKNHWVKSITAAGLQPEVVILEEYESAENLETMEKLAIAHYRSMGFRLTNATDGGEGALGRKDSLTTRQKKSMALKGVPKSASHRAALSILQGGRPLIETTTGVRYETQSEAARALGICPASVGRVLRNEYPNVKGYSFRYLENSCS